MSFLEFTIRFTEALVWPGTVFAVIYLLRNPVKSLLPSIEKLQYKEFMVSFREDAEETLDSIETEQAKDLEAEVQFEQIDNPQLAVINAWRKLEEAAIAKLRELAPEKNISDLEPNRALGYFEYRGALIPRTKQAISQLRRLRNQATHFPENAIPIKGAVAYVKAATTIQKQIESLSALPEMKLNRLTFLILEYNQLLDTGKYNYITIKDVHREIQKGTILRYIKDEAGSDVDFSLYLDIRDELCFETQYAKHLQSIYGGYAGQEGRKWGVENLGLCLLIAWTNEIIQQGSGWQPNENVA